MPIQPPTLDDITFGDLRELGLKHVREQMQAEWNDLSPGDPGVLLLELFAYLTEQLVYRMNRVPEKVYVSLLRLLGISLYPPVAASVTLTFHNESAEAVTVPARTAVTTSTRGPDEPVFITAREIEVPAAVGGDEDRIAGHATVSARHCRYWVEQFDSNGAPGQRLQLANPPILAPMRDAFALRVETIEGEERKTWTAVPNFSQRDPDGRFFTVDRHDGIIRFAPALQMTELHHADPTAVNGESSEASLAAKSQALAAVPGRHATIEVAYATGGGAGGNVAAGTLDTIVSNPAQPQLTLLTVTNEAPATGGQDAESFANAVARAPQEIYSLERAITARDYERLATRAGNGIARASAEAAAQRWRHGRPGTIEMHLLPVLTEVDKSVEQVTAERRAAGASVAEFARLRRVLADSQPLGTNVALSWVDFKGVSVEADIIFKERHSRQEACQRISTALDRLLQPVAGADSRTAWPFGQTLYTSDAYNVILRDEAVERISRLTLCVDEAPDRDVTAIAADRHQPHTWYVASGRRLFRSFNDGDGWELAPTFPDPPPDSEESITLIEACLHRPGLVAVWIEQKDSDGRFLRSRALLSTDCGENWHELQSFDEGRVEDMDWIMRADTPIMLLATDAGLFKMELSLANPTRPSGSLTAVADMTRPLYAVAAIKKDRQLYVAVAVKSRGGVFITNGLFLAYDIDLDWARTTVDLIGGESPPTADALTPPEDESENGEENSAAAEDDSIFKPLVNRNSEVSLAGADVRTLAVQHDQRSGEVFLWAGAMATGWSKDGQRVQGIGAFRWEIQTVQTLRSEWIKFPDWTGGSCRALAFAGNSVLAASQWGGVLRLDLDNDSPAWRQTSSVALPRRQPLWPNDAQRSFEALPAISANDDWDAPVAIAGGAQGIYLSRDRGERFSLSSILCYENAVTLPPNWLFSPGEHRICPPAQSEET